MPPIAHERYGTLVATLRGEAEQAGRQGRAARGRRADRRHRAHREHAAHALRDRPRRPHPGGARRARCPGGRWTRCSRACSNPAVGIVEQSWRLWNNPCHVRHRPVPGPARRRSASAPPAPRRRSARTGSHPPGWARAGSSSAATLLVVVALLSQGLRALARLPRRPLLIAAGASPTPRRCWSTATSASSASTASSASPASTPRPWAT